MRVQYSVFECRLSEVAALHLRHALEDVIEPSMDSIRFYRIPCSIESIRVSIGRDVSHTWGEPWIV